MMTNTKAIDRIRKLLALAGNNSSESEREAALAKAHAMLLEHNLMMADVTGFDKVEEPVGSESVLYKTKASRWARWICSAVAELYFCKFYWEEKDGKLKTTFVGQRADAEIAHAVTGMILQSVWSEALAFTRSRRAVNPALSTSTLMNNFVNSAAIAIHHRCKDLRKKAEQQTGGSTGTALVVVDLYKQRELANQAWIEANVKLRAPRKAPAVVIKDAAAREAGAAHGRSVPLTMVVGKA
jgi:hypothetical protein